MAAAVEYREIAPDPRLAPWVECFWSARRTAAPAGRPPHRVLPDGCIDLVFQLGGALDPEAPEPAVAVGTMTRPLALRQAGPVEHFGVRFRPGRAAAFLAPPADELTDRRIALGELWRGGRDLGERLRARPTAAARAELLAAALAARLSSPATGAALADPLVDRAVAAIRRRRGALPIAALAGWLGVTRQHLARAFRARVGVPPKTFARVVRFQAALAAARAAPRVDWADLGAALGYSDQPHLIAEFRALAGVSPARWLAILEEGRASGNGLRR